MLYKTEEITRYDMIEVYPNNTQKVLIEIQGQPKHVEFCIDFLLYS
jgi:hypothetical protein